MQLKALMRFKKETKGALQYTEVNTDGTPVPVDKCVAGGIYLRKSAISGEPKFLTITVDVHED